MVTGRRSSYMGSAATGALVAAALVLGGCTALTRDVLVKESGQPAQAVASHCSGSEWMDNSMIAVVPIPIVAFAMPTQELNEIKTDDVLRRCGPPERLANRDVEVNRGACVPTTLTRLITLGVCGVTLNPSDRLAYVLDEIRVAALRHTRGLSESFRRCASL